MQIYFLIVCQSYRQLKINKVKDFKFNSLGENGIHDRLKICS